MEKKNRVCRITPLETLRRNLGKSQKEMAAALGISISTFSDFERGRFTPRVRDIDRYCTAYKLVIFEMMKAINDSAEKDVQ